ncbi:MAG TPA: outer membrane beta-barrel protein [Verrucomicrobiae bacterium]|jgi:hypothetical protein|nr:outer membrane beta-barrel protein [Verrucomicrobiae bacterium]
MKYPRRNKTYVAVISAVAGLIASTWSLRAQADPKVDQLEKQNQELRKRLDAMDNILQKEGLEPSGAAPTSPIQAMSQMTISGFIEASYFYDIANTHDNHPAGYLWNTSLNSFTLNKIKLTFASPAPDKDKWDAAYRFSLIYGQDAPIVNTGSGIAGFSAVREGYIELNVPIGTGLDIKAGELISLLNWESGDGGAANPNFSQGYQWYYTGNPPDAGIQLSYDFNDVVGLKARLQNGLYNGPVESGPKTFMGGLYINPDKKTTLAFLGFVGRQDFSPTHWDIVGGSFLGSRQLTEAYNLSVATEFDWFHFANAPAAAGPGPSHGDFWSIGAWLTADFTPKLGAALRAEFLDDPSGFGTIFNSPAPGADTPFPAGIEGGGGQQLSSVTFTLDYKPAPNIKIQPEARWNHSSFSGALNGKRDQFIVGMGASYLF